GAALRLEERDHRPDLLGRELLRHHRHDRLVSLDHVGSGLVQRFEEILLAALPRLALAAARSDRAFALLVGEEVRRTGAEPVAGGAAADAVEDLLPRGHQLLGRYVLTEGERRRQLRVHSRTLIGA